MPAVCARMHRVRGRVTLHRHPQLGAENHPPHPPGHHNLLPTHRGSFHLQIPRHQGKEILYNKTNSPKFCCSITTEPLDRSR